MILIMTYHDQWHLQVLNAAAHISFLWITLLLLSRSTCFDGSVSSSTTGSNCRNRNSCLSSDVRGWASTECSRLRLSPPTSRVRTSSSGRSRAKRCPCTTPSTRRLQACMSDQIGQACIMFVTRLSYHYHIMDIMTQIRCTRPFTPSS